MRSIERLRSAGADLAGTMNEGHARERKMSVRDSLPEDERLGRLKVGKRRVLEEQPARESKVAQGLERW
jgi:hypothetical protein